MKKPIFLKFGGSLITDKKNAHTARIDVIQRLVSELSGYLKDHPQFPLILGHGSGSFGHFPAEKYKTRQGVQSEEQWLGFSEVWHEARALNTILMDQLKLASIQAIAFPPCSQVICEQGCIKQWDLTVIRSALANNIIPVIYGDTVFDESIGGTILSTEELFAYLAHYFKPDRILLAGIEDGVWLNYPVRTEIIKQINPENLAEFDAMIAQSGSPDVTGGMKSKVHSMMELVNKQHCNEISIFSGETPGNLRRELDGENLGTKIGRG